MRDDVDPAALEQAAEREISKGLIACQVAVARDNEVLWTRSFGSASADTRFWVASATKPIFSSAVWLLIGDGKLDVTRPVAHYLPEFAANGKQSVTVEQVLLMTCGFPGAPMDSRDGADPSRRIAQLAEWTLEYEPGTRYVYHGASAHWVLAELVERLTGQEFSAFVEKRVTRPLGLPRLLGIRRDLQTDIAQLSRAADPETRALYDYAAKIEAGEPGGGGVMTASTLALFYQGLLHNPGTLWSPEVLADGVGNVRCTLPDPLMNLPANRTLGVVIGAGFGTTWSESPTAFGWPGAGGQIGFAEPATGISFAFLQMGDTDHVRQFARGAKMSHLALQMGR
ncbi:MAG: beta-lactamase family protein [Deltaproteobacteria bacterium]|nr:beta-lactamase family protein [Deltaproteobacteria bacterium]MBW2697369.1 beta-lactamase family protein [Deltaproteobacteria bacterium]